MRRKASRSRIAASAPELNAVWTLVFAVAYCRCPLRPDFSSRVDLRGDDALRSRRQTAETGRHFEFRFDEIREMI
ncbi:hypothetical protein [Planctomicrobium sp. SH527]|uniref:hypothetical protein n=1 Tax=Planctomicrobium sp. SH527 TaxID=3448123 RepID=UPI003F5BDCC9